MKKRLCISEPWCFGAMWVNGLQGGGPRILSFLFISSVGLSLSQTQTFHINSWGKVQNKVIFCQSHPSNLICLFFQNIKHGDWDLVRSQLCCIIIWVFRLVWCIDCDTVFQYSQIHIYRALITNFCFVSFIFIHSKINMFVYFWLGFLGRHDAGVERDEWNSRW